MRPLVLLLVGLSCAAMAEDRKSCVYRHGRDQCFPFACLPASPTDLAQTDPDLIGQPGEVVPGFCGYCRQDPLLGKADCSDAACNAAGFCNEYAKSTPPVPVWPHFFLLTTDISINLADETPVRPIIGAGFLFQGAFSKTRPMVREEGGYLTRDLPMFYFDLGGSLAFSGSGQNLFANVGLTFYRPSLPLSLTTISVEGIYQRGGVSLFTDQSSDRFGVGLQIGFLQNLFIRPTFMWTARGTEPLRSFVLTIIYMKDLLGDLIPDRFQRFLPEALRP